MKKNYIAILTLLFLIIGSGFLINKVFAENSGLANVQYPIKELGSCKSKADCKLFCDKPTNTDACLNFAGNNNLMSSKEIDTAKKFIAADNAPGGCKTKDACSEYCDGTDHINECISFAEKNDLMPAKDLAEAKKVQAAINKGVTPPACKGKQACDTYCEDPNHMEECINFGVAAGFIEGEDVENSQKMLQAVKKGIKPPACKGKQACDEYCSSAEHIEECMTFAAEAGMMSDQEKENSQKMIKAVKSGVKPPACKGKECDTYCQQTEHFEECTNFALAAGFMSEQDVTMARKTGGKGPGGCKSKEECATFCNNPDNQETCFNFGKENGTIPEEDLKRMEDGKQQMTQTLNQAPPELIDCLNTGIGSDMVEKIKNGLMPARDISEKMQTCFQKSGPPTNFGEPGAGGTMPPGNDSKQFAPGTTGPDDRGERDQPRPGPGGCQSPEECQKYCESNPEQCKNSQQPPTNQNTKSNFQNSQTPSGQPCQGEECTRRPSPEFQSNQQWQQPQEGKMPERCEGDNCPQMPPSPDSTNNFQPQPTPPSFTPYSTPPAQRTEPTAPLPRENTYSPPPVAPGSGSYNNFIPNEPAPMTPPTEQRYPDQNPPPSSLNINRNQLVGSVLYAFIRLLIGY